MSSEGMGIARHEGKVIFVENAIPGDVVNVQIRKSKKSFSEAKITSIVEPSKNRKNADCNHFGTCGGCKWQHIQYPTQLQFKQQIVSDALSKFAGLDTSLVAEPILGCETDYFYRNKLEYSFSNKKWLTQEQIESGEEINRNALGFHVPRFFDKVIDIEKCWLQSEPSNAIRLFFKEYALSSNLGFYDLKEKTGFFRNLMVRTSADGQCMVVLIVGQNKPKAIHACLETAVKQFPTVNSWYYMLNEKRNDSLFDLEPVHFKGETFIVESLGNYRYKVGPKSFFQTNPLQAKRLYDLTAEFAGLGGNETVYDLYCGVGSIGIYLSEKAQKVIGIEEIADAIENAKENAALNQINNCEFWCGDVRKIWTAEFVELHGAADVIVVDPPRAGMHPDVIETLIKTHAPKIVYVSCNPSTQARDIAVLSTHYKLVRSKAVDMFPQTKHIENVVLLEKLAS